jgi:hypothetical protein
VYVDEFAPDDYGGFDGTTDDSYSHRHDNRWDVPRLHRFYCYEGNPETSRAIDQPVKGAVNQGTIIPVIVSKDGDPLARYVDMILADLFKDFRQGARLLARNPLFALTAALSLAIGIGADTIIFTIANALLFRAPAGVEEPARLVDVVAKRAP